MNISPVDQINNIQQAAKQDSPEALRKVAMQFEAILLMQLTAALNKTSYSDGEDGDEDLFGGDGGTDLAKQLFSEQLATTMAQAGGIGLADSIMRQIGGAPTRSVPGDLKGLSSAISAVREIKQQDTVEGTPLINKTARPMPLSRQAIPANWNEAEIVSLDADYDRIDRIEETSRNSTLPKSVTGSTLPMTESNGTTISTQVVSDRAVDSSPLNPSRKLSYQLPVSGRLSSRFGRRIHPIDRTAKFHTGLDLAVPRGTSVQAAAGGEVSFAGWSGGYGNLLIIQHPDGRETRYGHLDQLLVVVGDKVAAGQGVALSGSTGKSTGPHLHFEIRENGHVVDPTRILTKGLR